MIPKNYSKITHSLKNSLQNLSFPDSSQIYWLWRSSLVGRQDSGFVLPVVTLLLVMVGLVVGVLSYRSFERAKQVSGQERQAVLYNAATPAVDRAKLKLEYLFTEDNLPPLPSDVDLVTALSNDNFYTLPDETRVELDGITEDVNNNGVLDTEDTNCNGLLDPGEDLDNDGKLDTEDLNGNCRLDSGDNAWVFTNSNGQRVMYSILASANGRSIDLNGDGDTKDTVNGRKEDQSSVTLTSDDQTKADNLVVRNGPINLTGASTKPGCENVALSPLAGWSPSTSGNLLKAIQVHAVALDDSGNFATLEMQQDRQATLGNKWAAWFRYDMELFPGPDFQWNGASHSASNYLLASNSNETRFYLVSSPKSCVYTEDASEITMTEVDNDGDGTSDFQGQLFVGKSNNNSDGNKIFVDLYGETAGEIREKVEVNANSGDQWDSVINARKPAQILADPVLILTEDISRSRNPSDRSNKGARDTKEWDKLTNPLLQEGRFVNSRQDKPFLDDTYRADDRWGPKPSYTDSLWIDEDNIDITAATNKKNGTLDAGDDRNGNGILDRRWNGEPISRSWTLTTERCPDQACKNLNRDATATGVSATAPEEISLTRTTPEDPTSEEDYGYDGYWERRAKDQGLRIIVGQRLELGNPYGWVNEDTNGNGTIVGDAGEDENNNQELDREPLYPPPPEASPGADGIFDTADDVLPAVAAVGSSMHSSNAKDRRYNEVRQWKSSRDNLAAVQSTAVYHYLEEEGNFPVTCMATTAHFGTKTVEEASRTFEYVDTTGDGTPDTLNTDFLTGRGTNGMEFTAPFKGDASIFEREVNDRNSPLRIALSNLAYFAGDPAGAFPARQDTRDGNNANDAAAQLNLNITPFFTPPSGSSLLSKWVTYANDTLTTKYIGPVVHPYPELTMWGDYSNLRRAIDILNTNEDWDHDGVRDANEPDYDGDGKLDVIYANIVDDGNQPDGIVRSDWYPLSIADMTTLQTSTCTLGMLAYNLDIESSSQTLQSAIDNDTNIQDAIQDVQDAYAAVGNTQPLAVHSRYFLDLDDTAYADAQCPGVTSGKKFEIDNILDTDTRWGGDGCYSPQEWWADPNGGNQSTPFPYSSYDDFLNNHSREYYASFTADDWDKAFENSVGSGGLSQNDYDLYKALQAAIGTYNTLVSSKISSFTGVIADQVRRDRTYGFRADVDELNIKVDDILDPGAGLNSSATDFFEYDPSTGDGWDPVTQVLRYPADGAENTTHVGHEFSVGCSPGTVSLGLSSKNPNSELGLVGLAMALCGEASTEIVTAQGKASNSVQVKYPSLYYLFPFAAHEHDGLLTAEAKSTLDAPVANKTYRGKESLQTQSGQRAASEPYVNGVTHPYIFARRDFDGNGTVDTLGVNSIDFDKDGKIDTVFRPVEDGLGNCTTVGCTKSTTGISAADGVVSAYDANGDGDFTDTGDGDYEETLGNFVTYLGIKPRETTAEWKTPVSTSNASPRLKVNEVRMDTNKDGTYKTSDTEWYPAFMDSVMLNGREMMAARNLDLDLDLMRRTQFTSSDGEKDYWLPLPQLVPPPNVTLGGAIIYAFREDAVREDAIARPRSVSPNFDTWLSNWLTYMNNTTQGGFPTGYPMNANSATPSDSPVNPTNGISAKPVDFYADPDRRPYGFRLFNGIDLRRHDGTSFLHEDLRGMSFITDNPLYTVGNFNWHSKDGSATESQRIEEFTQKLPDDWSNFYTRSTLQTATNCSPTTPCFAGVGDTWRPVELIADAVSVLSERWASNARNDNKDEMDGYFVPGMMLSNGGNDGGSFRGLMTVSDRDLSWVRMNGEASNSANHASPIRISRRGFPLYCVGTNGSDVNAILNVDDTAANKNDTTITFDDGSGGKGPRLEVGDQVKISGSNTTYTIAALTENTSDTTYTINPKLDANIPDDRQVTLISDAGACSGSTRRQQEYGREKIFNDITPQPVPFSDNSTGNRSYIGWNNGRTLNETDTTRVGYVMVQGLVPSRFQQAYGGLHNFPRFNEKWGTLHFTGSMIQLNFSNYATGPFDQDAWEPTNEVPASGEFIPFYGAPNRRWGYDPALQYAVAGPVSRRFVTPGNRRSEFYRELASDDAYVTSLRCARMPGATDDAATPDILEDRADPNVPSNLCQ